MAAAGQCCSCVIAELCCVLDFAGKPALPTLLGRGVNLAGPSGYWVGHSSGSFAVGLMSDREPGLVPGSRGITFREAAVHAAGRPTPGACRSAPRAAAFPAFLSSPSR